MLRFLTFERDVNPNHQCSQTVAVVGTSSGGYPALPTRHASPAHLTHRSALRTHFTYEDTEPLRSEAATARAASSRAGTKAHVL